MHSLIVFSHLRWDFVYQRPQQIMSRLATHFSIHFIEEPMFDESRAHWQSTSPIGNVWVHRPYSPERAPGFDDRQLPHLQVLIDALNERHGLRDQAVWLYTPMALPLINSLRPRIVIYDCMDELSSFDFAPLQLQQRERALLSRADIVLTGGPSLHAAKTARRSDAHCVPSSVDRTHFAKATLPEYRSNEQGKPRLGFFGVIDERLDIGLLELLATEHPEWDLEIVGPIVKIDPQKLPVNPNIFYRGMCAYAQLPRLAAGWDVCLLPFASNASTRYISPTKTLEYMAAGKPIVSTPIIDVIELYGEHVRIGTGPDFVRQCELSLRESPIEREARREKADRLLATTSWDNTAARILSLIEAAGAAAPRPIASSKGASAPRVIIIGAGPTGLSAAYHVGRDCLVLEQHATVGGGCRSLEVAGFTFDYAGHIMFSNDEYVNRMYALLLGDNVHWQDREAWIYSKEVHTRYPFQAALHGLPPDVISECLIGAVDARNGANDSHEIPSPLDFEQFIHRTWGRGIARHFALPYNRKLWTVSLSSMETSWLGGRVPLPNLTEMIEGALQPLRKPLGPNARFGYPLRGGFQSLMDGFLPHLEGQLHLNAAVARIIPSRRKVLMASGAIYAYQQLISTMPLPVLIDKVGDEAPAAVRQAAAGLRHVGVRCVNLGVGRPHLTDKHWIYYPESTVFHRIFLQGNASPHCSPKGGFGLTCEITYSPEKPLPCDGEELIERCIRDCIDVGLIREDDPILVSHQVDIPYGYVVYDHARASNVKLIREWAQAHSIVLAGRYSEWEYYNSDHAFLAGRAAADAALSGKTAGPSQAALSPIRRAADEPSKASVNT